MEFESRDHHFFLRLLHLTEILDQIEGLSWVLKVVINISSPISHFFLSYFLFFCFAYFAYSLSVLLDLNKAL